jgi:hypothetical protein
MNINLSNSSLGLGTICLWVSLNAHSTTSFAQAPAVKGAKTDNNYANTTEINKTKGASDAQVLAEIEGNYGIGDVVRIVITTPKPTTEPLANPNNGRSNSIRIGKPNIPAGQISPPIGNLPAPQQGTTPPQYVPENDQPTASDPNPQRPNANGQMTPIGNRPAPRQTTTNPQYNGNNTPNGQPMASNPNTQRPNANGQMTPIGNRPAPLQNGKPPIVYEYYNSKGERIPPPNANGMTPIANRPAPQQTTTPPQYNAPNGQPNGSTPNAPMAQTTTPNLPAKTPLVNGPQAVPTPAITGSTTTNEPTAQTETITSKNASSQTEKTERISKEDRETRAAARSERAASSGGGSRSKASRSSGFSFSDIFSFGGSGMKTTKRRNMRSSKKYGCYRFN